MPRCKHCGTDFDTPLWKLDAVDFMQTDYGPRSSRHEKLRLDAGVFCGPKCMGRYLEIYQEDVVRDSDAREASDAAPVIGSERRERLTGAELVPAEESEVTPSSPGIHPHTRDYRQGILDVRGESVPYIVGRRGDHIWIAEIQLDDDATATGRGASEQEAISAALSVISGERVRPEELDLED
jgi:hypothetical protein